MCGNGSPFSVDSQIGTRLDPRERLKLSLGILMPRYTGLLTNYLAQLGAGKLAVF